jgi:hypothetical protein
MSSIVVSGDTSGAVTLAAPAVAGTNTLTLPAATATVSANVLMTAQNSTSGTSIDFTGIPSWAKRITVIFNTVSTSGTSNKLVQLGSGTIQNTGYVSGSVITFASVANSGSVTTGMVLNTPSAASSASLQMILTNISGFIWVASHAGIIETAGTSIQGGGVVTLSGALDRVRITTVSGTDTFDAGSINVLYE